MVNQDLMADIEKVISRQKIWDCLLRYTRGVDRLDAELIRSAFWPDAHDSHGQLNGSPEEFIATWMPTQGAREACQHFITNHSVESAGIDAADAETYFLVAIKNYGASTVEQVGGRYLDRFECRGGEWRIKTRLVVLDWQAIADGSQMTERLSRGHRGTRDRDDPSYERPVQPRPAPILPKR